MPCFVKVKIVALGGRGDMM